MMGEICSQLLENGAQEECGDREYHLEDIRPKVIMETWKWGEVVHTFSKCELLG